MQHLSAHGHIRTMAMMISIKMGRISCTSAPTCQGLQAWRGLLTPDQAAHPQSPQSHRQTRNSAPAALERVDAGVTLYSRSLFAGPAEWTRNAHLLQNAFAYQWLHYALRLHESSSSPDKTAKSLPAPDILGSALCMRLKGLAWRAFHSRAIPEKEAPFARPKSAKPPCSGPPMLLTEATESREGPLAYWPLVPAGMP